MIKKVLYLFFIFISTFFPVKGNNIDSLYKQVLIAKNDTIKVKKLLQYSTDLRHDKNYPKAIEIAKLAFSISQKINYFKGKAISYRLISRAYYLTSEFDTAKMYCIKALVIAHQINDKSEILKNYKILGDIYQVRGIYHLALDYYLKAAKIAENLKNDSEISSLYLSVGVINNDLHNYLNAAYFYRIAINISERTNDKNALFGIFYNMGTNFGDANQNDSALLYYSKAFKLKDSINDKLSLVYIYNAIGSIYSAKENNDSALFYFNKGLNFIIPLKNKECEATLNQNIGEIYSAKGNYVKAKEHFIKSLTINKETGRLPILVFNYKSLSDLSIKQGDSTRAFLYYYDLIKIKDSLNKLENVKYINEKIIKFESKIKDDEIKLLNSEKIQKASETKKRIANRNLIIVIIFSASLIIIFLTALVYNRRQRFRQNYFLQQLVKSQEDERIRIAKELHDGIGQNLLIMKNKMADDKTLMEKTIEELRSISRNLHPVQLEKLGLKIAIESNIEEVSKITDIYFSYEIEILNAILSSEKQINLYRIIQECISNIIKHSQARDARITLQNYKNETKLYIYDNGIGFNYSEAKLKKTLGLTSIKERVKLIGGVLKINSKPGETKIEITVYNG